jgi:hypothetical protein
VRRRSFARLLLLLGVLLIGFVGVAGTATLAVTLWNLQRTPREWAPYLEHRAERHRTAITAATNLVAEWLVQADRLAVAQAPDLPASLGASPARSGPLPNQKTIVVASMQALSEATAAAEPGDVIVVQPGRYSFTGSPIRATRPGSLDHPITVRAARLGDVVIESGAVETFKVSAPFWRFENLVMRGVCGDHADCEHAIHVVSGGSDILIRNNRFEDYNAQIKINGEDGAFPDRGVIQGNTFTDTVPRDTANPITPIDLVAASDWRISDNIITDFVRSGPDGATYGAFVKGAGENNVLERNLVVCEWKLRGTPGEHVGLSLGGGATGLPFRRELGTTGFEQVGGVIRDNLIVGCSDDGIYLNRAAHSVIDHNTLLDTAGIDARFLESSATITSNIVDGVIRGRDGAMIQGWDNPRPFLLGLFIGLHPQRSYFSDPAKLDLTWRSMPTGQEPAERRPDLCGRPRGTDAPPGAFVDFATCSGAQ